MRSSNTFAAFLALLAMAVSQPRLAAQEEPGPAAHDGPAAAPAPDSPGAPTSPPPADASGVTQDPPARVGRLSHVSGNVSFKPAGAEQWTHASVNRPVTRGDSLWTDETARAEIHLGTLALRLGPNSSLYVSNLDDRTVQVSLAQGSVAVRLREVHRGELTEIDLPNGAVTLQELGTYRVDVDPSGDQSAVTVRHGSAEVLASGSAFLVPAGQTAEIAGGDKATHALHAARQADDLDAWSNERDRREDHPEALRYVSRATVGYEDLDEHGTWSATSEYGHVWVPRGVPAGWAPYRQGHWGWVDPWGWTWIDDAPWGFAPFHYGRWVHWDASWAWVPGTIAPRPCYAPALVAFVGAGASVGWFPLGPREVYVPGYHTSVNYVRQVNSAANVNVTNISRVHANATYANRGAPGALTAVPQTVFARSQAVGPANARAGVARLDNAPVVQTAPVVPQAASLLGPAGTKRSPVVLPPAAVLNRAVINRMTPPAAPTPFAQRLPQLMKSPGRPAPPAPPPSPPAGAPQPRLAEPFKVLHPAVGQGQGPGVPAPAAPRPTPAPFQALRPSAPAPQAPRAAPPPAAPRPMPAPVQALRPSAPAPQAPRAAPPPAAPRPMPAPVQALRPSAPAPQAPRAAPPPAAPRPMPAPFQALRPAAPAPQAPRPAPPPAAPRPAAPAPRPAPPPAPRPAPH